MPASLEQLPPTTPAPVPGGLEPSHDGRPTADFSFADALAVIARRKLLVIAVPLVALAVAVGLVVTKPRVYEARTSFVAQSSDASRNRLAGLAAQFGVAVPGSDPARSPQFFVDLVTSHEVLRRVAQDTYPVPTPEGGRRQATLLSYLTGSAQPTPVALDRALFLTRTMIDARARRETGVVDVTVTTVDPALSLEIAKRLVATVNALNLEQRQGQASAEREFVLGRLASANAELRVAEDRLRSFVRQNRLWDGSPDLMLEHDRLAREVSMRQQVATSLAQSYETARIDEVRNTPIILSVEPPYASSRPRSRRLAERGLLALFGGFALALVLAFALELGPTAWRVQRRRAA